MKLLNRIRKALAPKCKECNEPMIRHHTDLVTGKVYWWCEKCEKVVHF